MKALKQQLLFASMLVSIALQGGTLPAEGEAQRLLSRSSELQSRVPFVWFSAQGSAKLFTKSILEGHQLSFSILGKNTGVYLSYRYSDIGEHSAKLTGPNGVEAGTRDLESYYFHSVLCGMKLFHNRNFHLIAAGGLSFHEYERRGAYASFTPASSGPLVTSPRAAMHNFQMRWQEGFGLPLEIRFIPRVHRAFSPEISFQCDLNAQRSLAFVNFGWNIGQIFYPVGVN